RQDQLAVTFQDQLSGYAERAGFLAGSFKCSIWVGRKRVSGPVKSADGRQRVKWTVEFYYPILQESIHSNSARGQRNAFMLASHKYHIQRRLRRAILRRSSCSSSPTSWIKQQVTSSGNAFYGLMRSKIRRLNMQTGAT
ncbi:hypothetical protein L9F63_005722, partial [Diploptera punctata]